MFSAIAPAQHLLKYANIYFLLIVKVNGTVFTRCIEITHAKMQRHASWKFLRYILRNFYRTSFYSLQQLYHVSLIIGSVMRYKESDYQLYSHRSRNMQTLPKLYIIYCCNNHFKVRLGKRKLLVFICLWKLRTTVFRINALMSTANEWAQMRTFCWD